MSCLDEDAVLAWLGGQLEEAELAAVEAHVDTCAECRRLVSTLAAETAPTQVDDVPPPSQQPSSLLDIGSVVNGRFELERVAGHGGMGRVYRARDLRDGGHVALKLVEVEDARFAREARVLAELAHPAIVRHVTDGVAENGSRYLVMEWLDGEDLADRLARGPLGVEETLTLGARVASALGAAHAHGVVHRDVKPSNLFLPGGRVDDVKVVDFGLARAPAPTSLRTSTGTLLGTPGYMSPEQARGDSNIGPAADVFSLGCVLYECLTGERAFPGSNVVAVLSRLLTDKPPRPRARARHVPRGLDALVARMLSRDPSQRPANGAAVGAELAVLGSLRALVRPSMLVAATGAIACAALVAAGVSLAQSKLRTPAVAAERAEPSMEPRAITDHPAPAGTPAEAAAEYKEGLAAIRDAALNPARTHLERAVEIDPSLAAAHLRLAIWTDTVMTAAESRAHYQAARKHANKLSPRDQELLEAVAPGFHLEPPDLDEAGRRLRALGDRHPHDAELGLLGVGVSGGKTRAGDYEAVLRIDPKFAYAWWARANAQYRVNDMVAANASIDRCLEAAPAATLCILLRIRIEAREGRCEEMERDARLVLAVENGGDYGYGHLANALAGRGADRAAVEEAVRSRALATRDPRQQQKVEVYDRAQVAVAFGDFVDAERQARSLEELVRNEPFVQDHVRWAVLLVEVLQEVGETVRAGKVADGFLRRRAAWRSVAKRPNDDPMPLFLAATERAGLRSREETSRDRAAWAAEWRTKLGPSGDEEIWVQEWARPARTARELTEAAKVIPDGARSKTILPSPPGWLFPQGFSNAYGGRAQLEAGQPREAAATLASVAKHCGVLGDAISHRRSNLWLGQAYEATGETAGACEAYRAVLRHWGRARPRSVTAEAARARVRALRCERVGAR